MAKFSVSYTRTVCPQRFEALKIGMTEEFDDNEVPRDWAFAQVRSKVEEQIKATLHDLGFKGR